MRCWCAGPKWSKPATTSTTPQPLPQLHPAPSTTSPPQPHPNYHPLPPGAAFSVFIPPPPGHRCLPAHEPHDTSMYLYVLRGSAKPNPAIACGGGGESSCVCVVSVVPHPEFLHLVCGCSPRLVFAPSALYLQFTIYTLLRQGLVNSACLRLPSTPTQDLNPVPHSRPNLSL